MRSLGTHSERRIWASDAATDWEQFYFRADPVGRLIFEGVKKESFLRNETEMDLKSSLVSGFHETQSNAEAPK